MAVAKWTLWEVLDLSEVEAPESGSGPPQFWVRLERALVRRRTLFALVGPLPLLLMASPRPSWLLAGAAVSVAGALLRVWAAGCITKNEALCHGGPYARVRNPLYLGSLLVLLGYCLMSGVWWTPLVWIPLFALFYVPAIASEERFLSRKFGDEFDRYRGRVPPLFPALRGRADSQRAVFSLRRALRENREYQGLSGTIVMIGLFAAVTLLRGWASVQ